MMTYSVVQLFSETCNAVSDATNTESNCYPVADMDDDLGLCAFPTPVELDAAYGEFGHTYCEEVMRSKRNALPRVKPSSRPDCAPETPPPPLEGATVSELCGLPVENPSRLKESHEKRFLPHTAAYTVATWVINTFVEELHAISQTPGGVHALQSLSGLMSDWAAESGSLLGRNEAFHGNAEEQAKLFAGLSQCLAAFVTPE